MNEIKQNKLKKFVADEVMVSAVYEVLLEAFLGGKAPTDVHVLAASRLAVDFLKQGWKELDKYALDEESEKSKVVQIGL